jgi:general secretion pathway protein G
MQQQNFHRRHQSGLTLVESMVAVVLVGVLMAIALPVWNGWRDRLHVGQAVTDIAALSALIEAHQRDNLDYPASLADIGNGGRTDPWGQPYVYLRLEGQRTIGQARKNRSLVPLNTDFDLYSRGKDGRSASPLTAQSSRDDVVRANNGRFIGLASTY